MSREAMKLALEALCATDVWLSSGSGTGFESKLRPAITAIEEALAEQPAQRTWVGLTDEERNDCLVSADPCEALAEPEARQLMEDVEAKLKERNT